MLKREHHENQLAGIARLEARLSFRFAVLQRMLDRQISRILARHDMSLATYRVLITIDAFEEMAAADLVRMIAVDKALVSRSVADLVAAGLLQTRADPRHARRRFLSLTPAGAELLARVGPDVAARNAALDALFDADQRTAFDAALDRLTQHAADSLDGDPEIESAA